MGAGVQVVEEEGEVGGAAMALVRRWLTAALRSVGAPVQCHRHPHHPRHRHPHRVTAFSDDHHPCNIINTSRWGQGQGWRRASDHLQRTRPMQRLLVRIVTPPNANLDPMQASTPFLSMSAPVLRAPPPTSPTRPTRPTRPTLTTLPTLPTPNLAISAAVIDFVLLELITQVELEVEDEAEAEAEAEAQQQAEAETQSRAQLGGLEAKVRAPDAAAAAGLSGFRVAAMAVEKVSSGRGSFYGVVEAEDPPQSREGKGNEDAADAADAAEEVKGPGPNRLPPPTLSPVVTPYRFNSSGRPSTPLSPKERAPEELESFFEAYGERYSETKVSPPDKVLQPTTRMSLIYNTAVKSLIVNCDDSVESTGRRRSYTTGAIEGAVGI